MRGQCTRDLVKDVQSSTHFGGGHWLLRGVDVSVYDVSAFSYTRIYTNGLIKSPFENISLKACSVSFPRVPSASFLTYALTSLQGVLKVSDVSG